MSPWSHVFPEPNLSAAGLGHEKMSPTQTNPRYVLSLTNRFIPINLYPFWTTNPPLFVTHPKAFSKNCKSKAAPWCQSIHRNYRKSQVFDLDAKLSFSNSSEWCSYGRTESKKYFRSASVINEIVSFFLFSFKAWGSKGIYRNIQIWELPINSLNTSLQIMKYSWSKDLYFITGHFFIDMIQIMLADENCSPIAVTRICHW